MNILWAVLVGLLSLYEVMPHPALPLHSGGCGHATKGEAVDLRLLEHGKPVTLDYHPGQAVTLANDPGGKARLQGRSVVAVEFTPSGKRLGYGVAPESLPVQEVSALLVPGGNRIQLIAANHQDRAWLTVTQPCPTATRVLMPTPTPTVAAIIPPTPTVRHAEEIPDAGNGDMPVAEATPSRQPRLVRILIALALLGLLLALATGRLSLWREDVERLRSLWVWLRQWSRERFG